MSIKNPHIRATLFGMVIILMLACNVPTNPTAAPLAEPQNLATTQVGSVVTDTQALPLATLPPSKTPTPIVDHFVASATPTMTRTMTATVDNFGGIINFGGGGTQPPSKSKTDAKYNALGGEGSFLGQPAGDEQDTTDGFGRFRVFQYGYIFWTQDAGAFEVHGLIGAKWAQFGLEKSFLGYPLTDETVTPDGIGRYNHFQGGSIYWSPDTGAYEVHGAIRDKWAALGWEKSFLGYPLTDESITPDGIGRYNHFQGGSIYWTPSTGAYEVHGLIRDKWAELGWEKSCLGYPISDEENSTGGWARQSRFQHGIIQWSPDKGAVPVCY